MPTAVEAIQSELEDVEKRLEDYDELVEQRDRLRAALAVLEGKGAPRAARAPSRASGGRSEPLDEGKIIHAIHVYGDAAPATAIREQLGLPDSTPSKNKLAAKLKQMVDAGTLKKEGDRRATKYRA